MQWVNELGALPCIAGLEAGASLLGLLHSPGVTHANYSVTSHQPLKLVLSPALSALRAQGDLDEPAQANHSEPDALMVLQVESPSQEVFKP